MASIFTRILNGEIPCQKLAEDDRYFSFLDIRPVTRGHALVIPKQEIDYIFDMPDDLLSGLLTFAKPVARAIREVVPCRKIGVTVIGIEVPHTHVHLIPINRVADMSFANAAPGNPVELAELGDRIRAVLARR